MIIGVTVAVFTACVAFDVPAIPSAIIGVVAGAMLFIATGA